MNMIKKQTIPDTTGTIIVRIEGDAVKKFCTASRFKKQLEQELEEVKTQLRDAAEQALAGAGDGARAVLFRSGEGSGSVLVTVPDLEKASSLTNLESTDARRSLKKAGVESEELAKVSELQAQVILSGRLALWMIEQIETWQSQQAFNLEKAQEEGVLEIKQVRKLLPSAIQELKTAAAKGDETAKVLVDVGLKKMSVTEKEY